MKFQFTQVLGIFLAVCASFAWSLIAAISKEIYIETNISPLDLLYFRFLVPFVLTLPITIINKVNLFGMSKEVYFDVLARSVLWTICASLNFVSIKIMPLTKYIVIFSTSPIMTSIAGYVMINEKLSVFDFMNCIISFTGLVLIVTNPNTDKSNPIVANDPWWSFILPTLSACFAAIGDNLQRKIANKVSPIISQMWMYTCSMCIVPVLSLAMHSLGDNNLPSFTLTGIGYFLLLGITGVLGITFYMLSLKYEKAGRVAAINYLQILIMMFIDTFYFKIRLTLRDIIGASMILICNFAITLLKAMEVIS